MQRYELMVCFRPDLDEESVGALAQRLNALVTDQGGEVTKENSMGRRRLAYPIRHYHEGYYQVVNCALPPAHIAELEHQLLLDEDVLRHIVVRENEKA